MEQLRQLGGRLLGKKRVAVILGLLGLCCPSSLWAEKLDTTFVLDIDMTIDMTPCYYTKYNGSGQIVGYGNYLGDDLEGDYDQSCVYAYYRFLGGGYSRINIGIVTNEEGLPLDTLFYACDKVTKQWREVPSLLKDHQCSYEFYDNGMFRQLNYHEYQSYQYFSGDKWVTEEVPSESVYITYSKNGYPSKVLHETYSAAGLYQVKIGTDSHEELYFDTWGNYSIWNSTTYDERHNLIQTVYENIVCTHAYDSLDRRIKTVRYDSTETGFVMKDSIVYTYGNSLKEGEPCILSTFRISQPIDGFSSDQFHYDFSSIVTYKDFRFITPFKTSVEKSFDPETSTLSVIVKGANYAYDSTDVNTYTFTLKKAESFMTALRPDSILSIDFSPEKYQYDELENYYISYFLFYQSGYTGNYFSISSDDTLKNGEKSARIHFDVSENAHAIHSYDARNGIFTITVTGSDVQKNPDNKHTYTFKTKKIEKAYISSLRYNNKEFEGFSPDVYDYEMPADATLAETSSWDFDVETYPEDLYTIKEYSHSTHTMYITLLAMHEYSGNADTLALYQFHYKPDLREVYDKRIKGISNIVNGFSENVFEYELWGKYYPGCLGYTVWNSSDSIIIDESFDEQTNILTVSASFKNDSIRVTNYRFHFPEGSEEIIPPTLYISTKGGNALDGIIVDNTEFEVIGFFYSSFCQCEVVDGKIVSDSYDESTNVWTIIVTDDFGSSQTTYHIHFKHPFLSSFTIKGEPLDTFSADTYDYLFDMEYDSSTVSYELPDDVDATESFNKTTNILTIRLTSRKTYGTVEYKFHFRPVDGVDDFLGDQVSLYVTDKTICVDGAEEPISVYNLLGTLVGTGRGEEARIPVSQAGVYVVKAGGKAAKVVVK